MTVPSEEESLVDHPPPGGRPHAGFGLPPEEAAPTSAPPSPLPTPQHRPGHRRRPRGEARGTQGDLELERDLRKTWPHRSSSRGPTTTFPPAAKPEAIKPSDATKSSQP